MERPVSVLLYLATALLPACSVDSDPSAATDGRQTGLGWRLGDRPILTIGEIDGPEAIGRLPFMVPDYGHGPADLLSDDRIALADRAANEIRIYDRNGDRLVTIGREGPGPGEFRNLYGMMAFAGGDSIAAWETSSATTDLDVSIFSAEGAFARKTTVANNEGLIVVGVHDDGSIVVGMNPSSIHLRAAMNGTPLPVGDRVREPLGYRRYSAAGNLLSEFGPFAGIEFWVSAAGGVDLVLFGRQTHVHAGRDRLYAADDDDFSISAFAAADGSLVSTMTRAHQPVAVPAAEMERMLARPR